MLNKIFSTFILFSLFIQTSFGAVYEYNIATVKVEVFNNGLPISTGNVAGVEVESTATMSGSVIVSDSSYNIATVRTEVFNSGLPITTGQVAKVEIDKTIGTSSGFDIENDNFYNIATVRTLTFNSGLPISTGKAAKVEVDADDFATGETIYNNDVYYNIAAARSLVFNSGLPITTGRTAKVEIDSSLGSGTGFLYGSELNYNIASVRSLVFNSGLPINTGKTAKVIVLPVEDKVDEYTEEYDVDEDNTINQTFRDENGNITYSGSTVISTTTGSTSVDARSISTNAKNYVYLGYSSLGTAQITRLYNNDGDFKIVNKGSYLIHGENGYYQKIIKTRNNGDSLDFGDELKLTKQLISDDTTYVRQNVEITDVALPPILTYPYYFKNQEQSYVIRNENTVIKGVGYPDSTLQVELDGKTYYVQVNSEGLFEFRPDKFSTTDGELLIKFQYVLIDGNYTNYLLETPTSYTLKIRTDESFEQPYILNIYNDDDIYSDVVYLEGYANPGELNYRFKNISNTQTILEGKTIVGSDKKFELLILDKEKLIPGNDYIVEVRNNGGLKERKAFSLKGNTKDKIGLINFKDYDTTISSRPVIIGYSKLSVLNNDTIRGYACEIGEGAVIDKCPEDDRIFLGTTNADENGLFIFRTLKDLKDGKIYMINFYNTSNSDYNKNIILRVDLEDGENIFRSQVLNIYNNLIVSNRNLELQGYTIKNSTVEVYDSSNSLIGSTTSNEYGLFDVEVFLPTDGEITVKFINGSETYSKEYKLIFDENFDTQNNGSNYYLNFLDTTLEILQEK